MFPMNTTDFFFFLQTLFSQNFFLLIYLFLAVLGLRFCVRAFSSCGERGPLFIAVRGPLTVAASPVAEHRLQTRRLSSCGSRAQLLRGMWDPPRPGLEPVSPALAGGLSTTASPGKPNTTDFISPSVTLIIHFFYLGCPLLPFLSIQTTFSSLSFSPNCPELNDLFLHSNSMALKI